MRSARQPLSVHHGLLWLQVELVGSGPSWTTEMVLDTGTAHTIISSEMAKLLGFSRSRRAGIAHFETPFGVVDGYTIRMSRITALKRSIDGMLVGVEKFRSDINIPGILGWDFFDGTDLLLSLRTAKIAHLAW